MPQSHEFHKYVDNNFNKKLSIKFFWEYHIYSSDYNKNAFKIDEMTGIVMDIIDKEFVGFWKRFWNKIKNWFK